MKLEITNEQFIEIEAEIVKLHNLKQLPQFKDFTSQTAFNIEIHKLEEVLERKSINLEKLRY